MSKQNGRKVFPIPVRIAGVGRSVPARRVSSIDLEKECNLPEGWCKRNQGVEERRWVEQETASSLGAGAVREAVRDAGMELDGIHLLINASTIPEQMVPDGSSLILRELGMGASGVAGFSMHTSCLGFLTAFDMASCLIGLGRFENAVIVSSEVTSGIIHRSVPATYTLLGDGAAAAVLVRSKEEEASCVHGAVHRTYGSGADHARLLLGSRVKPTAAPVNLDDCIFKMDGKRILRSGERYVPGMLDELMRCSGVRLEEIALAITHQASKVALDFISLNLSENRLVRIIDRFGNCGAASIPMTLYEAIQTGRMRRGDKVLITGPAGAGMMAAGVVITY